jgi:cyanoexosortase B-associated protein
VKSSPVKFAQSLQGRGWVAMLLLAIAAFTALPGYFGKPRPWAQPLEMMHLEQVQALRQSGLALPGWQTENHEEIRIGVRRWSMQTLVREPSGDGAGKAAALPDSAILLLRSPMRAADAPEIDWVSFSGEFGLRVDSRRNLRFSLENPENSPISVDTRFSRHWNAEQTYAVVQWYAWPTGGSADPGRWFWADQRMQWTQQQRMPWVAIALLLPMEPLGNLEDARADAEFLAKAVQSALMAGAFPGAFR